jgi:DNA-binding SARP family transcriptional activator/nucleotide-binding universal stress UspA family protein
MDIGILGPLEVRQGERVLPVKGAKQRALLALLALHANEVVSTDRLLDELWEQGPPASGATALQVRVSQLRKSLGEDGDRIATEQRGYVLRLNRGELDLFRFEQLFSEAEGAEPEGASAKLQEALALWRGPALADFVYESFAKAAITRLEDLRLVAVERRIDADLVLGRHGPLVSELEVLVAEHPLREAFRGQLMLALYRSGRQAEALDSYRLGRSTFVREFGLEPSPSLQELERAILRHDPALELERPGEPSRSILVAPLEHVDLNGLVALAEPLARHPRRELILTRLVPERELAAASASLNNVRESLLAKGHDARVAVFTSADRGRDLVRLASEQDVDLVVIAAGADIDDSTTSVILADAPCDVALLADRPGGRSKGAVLVPFAGTDHDWSAIELGSWIARNEGATLRLAGPRSEQGDASRLLASASLAVQRALGVAAEPLLIEAGADGLVAAADEAALVVLGLPDRWRTEGLGEVRATVAKQAGCPVVLVRRGLRPGGLAPPASYTRFTWSARL